MGIEFVNKLARKVGLFNTSNQHVNPATEEKQNAIITALGKQQATDLEGGGKIAVGTTAVELTFAGVPEVIIISSDVENTGLLFIGKSDVSDDGSNAITFLDVGESITLDYDDSENAIYVVSDTAAQNFWKGSLL